MPAEKNKFEEEQGDCLHFHLMHWSVLCHTAGQNLSFSSVIKYFTSHTCVNMFLYAACALKTIFFSCSTSMKFFFSF